MQIETQIIYLLKIIKNIIFFYFFYSFIFCCIFIRHHISHTLYRTSWATRRSFKSASKSLLQTMPHCLCLRVNLDPSVFLVLLWRIVKVELGFKTCGVHDLPQETFTERSNRPRILDSCDCIHNRRIENIRRIWTTKFLFIVRSLAFIVSTTVVVDLAAVVLVGGFAAGLGVHFNVCLF
jgi:hypothetical protein